MGREKKGMGGGMRMKKIDDVLSRSVKIKGLVRGDILLSGMSGEMLCD